MELFEELRRELTYGVSTVRGVARKFHVHRRVVRQALASTVPPDHKVPERSAPALDPVRQYIEDTLTALNLRRSYLCCLQNRPNSGASHKSKNAISSEGRLTFMRCQHAIMASPSEQITRGASREAPTR